MQSFMKFITITLGVTILLTAVVIGSTPLTQGQSDDEALAALLEAQGVGPISSAPEYDPALVTLGQALFFDKLLSGNRDIACATCHHPTLNSGDGLALSLGTGNTGLGPARTHNMGSELIPRNAPDLYNRTDWTVIFWDGRLFQYEDGMMITPAGEQTPPDLIHPVAAQALFPVTSRDEMRGYPGDMDIYGGVNEVALVEDGDFTAMWATLMTRVLAQPAYVAMLAAAYPDLGPEDYDIQHLANAIGAFELHAFTFTESAWNRYLQGEMDALSDEARAGALLFYGEANCSSCHRGSLLTDQAFHNVAVPQFGPGKGSSAPLDFGRMLETDIFVDRFTFRTPSLHNVTLTGPYMHNGAFATLEDVIRHKLDPANGLATYAPSHLPDDVIETLHNDAITQEMILATLDPLLWEMPALSDTEIGYLVAFLEALTDPAAADLSYLEPESVPSGLPVSD